MYFKAFLDTFTTIILKSYYSFLKMFLKQNIKVDFKS